MLGRAVKLTVLTALLVGTAAAQEKPPATAPATPVAADQSTPQGAYVLFLRASHHGNTAALPGLVHASGPDELNLVDLLQRIVEQNRRFREAITRKFGEATADLFVGSNADELAVEQEISQIKPTIDKTTATLPLDPQGGIRLVQADGKWKLPISDLVDASITATLLKVLEEVTTELDQGKYATEIELRDALRSKRAAATFAAAQAAASRPATAPTRP
jgi:hypothetical protein